jgi:hypothetical protein
MALRFLIDENQRRRLFALIQRMNQREVTPIDAVQVGDSPDLPLGTGDLDVLLWAEREQRILVSSDRRSLPKFLTEHLAAGHHSPGVFLIRPRRPLSEVVMFLTLVARASESWEWLDRCTFIPFDERGA